jgi:hypothetical protein
MFCNQMSQRECVSEAMCKNNRVLTRTPPSSLGAAKDSQKSFEQVKYEYPPPPHWDG